MCLAQEQHSDAGETRTPRSLGLESSTLPLSHCAPILLFSYGIIVCIFSYGKADMIFRLDEAGIITIINIIFF